MGGAGFEPAKVEPPDLQSGPFSHLGIHPRVCPSVGPVISSLSKTILTGLRGPCSRPRQRASGESRTHNRRFTKPVLCQLSYASSDSIAEEFLTITTSCPIASFEHARPSIFRSPPLQRQSTYRGSSPETPPFLDPTSCQKQPCSTTNRA